MAADAFEIGGIKIDSHSGTWMDHEMVPVKPQGIKREMGMFVAKEMSKQGRHDKVIEVYEKMIHQKVLTEDDVEMAGVYHKLAIYHDVRFATDRKTKTHHAYFVQLIAKYGSIDGVIHFGITYYQHAIILGMHSLHLPLLRYLRLLQEQIPGVNLEQNYRNLIDISNRCLKVDPTSAMDVMFDDLFNLIEPCTESDTKSYPSQNESVKFDTKLDEERTHSVQLIKVLHTVVEHVSDSRRAYSRAILKRAEGDLEDSHQEMTNLAYGSRYLSESAMAYYQCAENYRLGRGVKRDVVGAVHAFYSSIRDGYPMVSICDMFVSNDTIIRPKLLKYCDKCNCSINSFFSTETWYDLDPIIWDLSTPSKKLRRYDELVQIKKTIIDCRAFPKDLAKMIVGYYPWCNAV